METNKSIPKPKSRLLTFLLAVLISVTMRKMINHLRKLVTNQQRKHGGDVHIVVGHGVALLNQEVMEQDVLIAGIAGL